MKPIRIDTFCHLKFLSQLRISPEGGSAAMVVSETDKKKDEYRSFLYLHREKGWEKLTSFGHEAVFQYLDENTILFPGKREEEDEGSLTSRWYTISLRGGEAQEAFAFPIPVMKLLPLPDGNYYVLGKTFPGFEALYTGNEKLHRAFREKQTAEKDYEVIGQAPWWWNGQSYTKGAYTSLFHYDVKKKKLRRVSAVNENISQADLSPDKKTLFYMSSPVAPLLPMTGASRLFRMELPSEETECLTECRPDFELFSFLPGKSFLLIFASDGKYGLNTDPDFWKWDYASHKLELYARYGESIGSSVGADIRYGGGQSAKMDGDTLYFISTRFDGAYLFTLEEGTITQLDSRPGSVDCFDVKDGKILMAALRDMRAQEVYDGNGKRLSRFNDAALRGFYVAEPENLTVNRGSYDVHGFVLKPFGYDPSKKYPVILDIHGGPKTVYGPVFYHEMQYWAGKGYFVIFCNPTGSDGRGAFMDIRGKYGTVDYEDIMAFCDAALDAWPAMDKNNVFETGGSYGGFMTNWIIGHTDRFRACASQRSISNWFSFYGVSDIGTGFVRDQNASDPWNDPEKLWEHSPMKYADRVKTPTLFIHSFEDYRCPIDQGYQMFTALLAHGVESRMVCFRGENHELSRSGKPSHRLRRLSEITEWFEKHKV